MWMTLQFIRQHLLNTYNCDARIGEFDAYKEEVDVQVRGYEEERKAEEREDR